MNSCITEDMKYVDNFVIASYMVDAQKLLKPSAFMDLAQEAAYHASDSMHFGYHDLQKKHVVWVLSRMQIHFIRRPSWNEKVSLYTWCRASEGLFFLRDFCMKDEAGNAIVEATTAWTVIDVFTRKMVRANEISDIVDPKWICSDNVLAEQAAKVVIPRGVEPEQVTVHKVGYSDVDVVGHANNTRYMAWAIDTIDYNYVNQHEIKDVSINFNHECRPDQDVTLKRYKHDNQFFISGHIDALQTFALAIVFS